MAAEMDAIGHFTVADLHEMQQAGQHPSEWDGPN